MPAWIHERADHIRRKNPSMPKSEAFAIATQQSYAAGKAPKKYGTTAGRQEAKKKYDEPKSEYTKTPSPSHKTKTSARLALWKGLGDELEKIATSPTRAAGPANVIKMKPPSPKLVSKPLQKDPDPPASTADQISSSRVIVPPPVTAAGAY